MKKKSSSFYKRAFLAALLVILNLCTVMVTSYIFSYLNSEEKQAKDYLTEQGVSIDKLNGMSFSYKMEYQFKGGEIRNIDGHEEYYWDGSKFLPISESLK